MEDPDGRLPVRRKWLRLGVTLTVLHYLFLLLVVALLRVDLGLALVVAGVGGVVGGVALTVYVRRVADRD